MHPAIASSAISPVLGSDYLLLSTSTPGKAEDHLSGFFTRHRLDIRKNSRALSFRHHRAMMGDLAINHLAYGPNVTVSIPALPDFYLLEITLKGACRISDGSDIVDLPTGAVFVMNPGRTYIKEWGEDSEQLIVQINRSALEKRLFQETGRLRGIDFDFRCADPGSAASVVRAIDYLCSDLRDPHGRLRDPGPRQCFSDMLLSLLLARLGEGSEARSTPPVSPAAPYYVRRAESFIRERATDDISLGAIAAAAGVNCRTLNAGFRRFRETTPMTYLRDVRLDRARRLLLRGDAEATVTDVALACNFNHLGRFAQCYAERFGERPSETLRLGPPERRHH